MTMMNVTKRGLLTIMIVICATFGCVSSDYFDNFPILHRAENIVSNFTMEEAPCLHLSTCENARKQLIKRCHCDEMCEYFNDCCVDFLGFTEIAKSTEQHANIPDIPQSTSNYSTSTTPQDVMDSIPQTKMYSTQASTTQSTTTNQQQSTEKGIESLMTSNETHTNNQSINQSNPQNTTGSSPKGTTGSTMQIKPGSTMQIKPGSTPHSTTGRSPHKWVDITTISTTESNNETFDFTERPSSYISGLQTSDNTTSAKSEAETSTEPGIGTNDQKTAAGNEYEENTRQTTDMSTKVSTNETWLAHANKLKSYLVCEPPKVSQLSSGSVRVQKCPPQENTTTESSTIHSAYKSLCESNEVVFLGAFYFITSSMPVTDDYGIVYRNMYCALCNSIEYSQLTPWRIYIITEWCIDLEDLPTTLTLSQKLSVLLMEKKCPYSFIPPPHSVLRTCFKGIDEPKTQTDALCNSFNAPIEIISSLDEGAKLSIWKNIVCWAALNKRHVSTYEHCPETISSEFLNEPLNQQYKADGGAAILIFYDSGVPTNIPEHPVEKVSAFL